MIIDSHTHCFPDKIASGAVGSLARTSFLEPKILPTADRLLESMKAAGIDKSLVLPIATTVRQVESCNAFAAKLCEREGLVSFGTVHPDYPDVKGALRSIRESGMRGIKLHPDFQGYFIDSPEMVRVMYLAAQEGLIIYLHCGADISYPEINLCTPERVARVLDVLPGARIVCAHLGGYGYLSQATDLLAPTDVMIDTAAMFGFFPDSRILEVIRAFGAHRVLFGTDSPWLSQAQSLMWLRSLGLDENELELIEGGNARKLLF